MRKLLGKGVDTTNAPAKTDALKTATETGAEHAAPGRAGRVERPEQTLSERLQAQSQQQELPATQAADSLTRPRPPDEAAEPAPEYSVIGESMTITGELEAAEDLMIAGRLEGSVQHTAKRLIIGRTGVVKADIETQNLLVEGLVEGDIDCRDTLVLAESARVTGNIRTARLNVVDGAFFNGNVVMVNDTD